MAALARTRPAVWELGEVVVVEAQPEAAVDRQVVEPHSTGSRLTARPLTRRAVLANDQAGGGRCGPTALDVLSHRFGRRGLTAYLSNGGLERAQQIAGHRSPKTTQLYDRTADRVTVHEIERIVIRERNTVGYRLAHWPIWIWVCYITPGPLTFDLFARGFDLRMAVWLGVVLAATGVAGLRGRLPGVEPRPYIIRFTEDKPNPVYRRVCYTLAWSDVVTFALLNLSSLVVTIMTGGWYLPQLYEIAYFPLAVAIWILGAAGMLPRAKRSTGDDWRERRCFYGAVWAVCLAQPVLWLLLAVLPRTRGGGAAKLVAFVAVLAGVGWMAYRGMLPRTRSIVPGELAISD